MTELFKFGEDHPDYPVRVLNEREARGAAGIMFLFALIAFMNAWFKGDFSPTKLTIVAFFIDFFIRVVVNPRYSPTLIMARWMVNKQTVEYVGAPQKRFAWGIGLGLATLMMYLLVLNEVRGPINMVTCLICLMLLFFETAFGVCIGCKLYQLFNKEKAQLCPGNVCEVKDREPIQMVTWSQALMTVVYVAWLFVLSPLLHATTPQPRGSDPVGRPSPKGPEEEARCRVPEFAKKLGHEEKWKLHNGC
ncbi:MAG: DUF4395 domain-containing protein [Limnohabitans sp.]